MTPLSDRKLRQWASHARKIWPLSHPVRVIRFPLSGPWCELSWWSGSRYIIGISPELCVQASLDALLHGYAHLHLLDEDHPHWHAHPDDFFLRFGELYRAWHREPALTHDEREPRR